MHTYPTAMFRLNNFTTEGYSCMADKAPTDRHLTFNSASNLYANAEEVRGHAPLQNTCQGLAQEAYVFTPAMLICRSRFAVCSHLIVSPVVCDTFRKEGTLAGFGDTRLSFKTEGTLLGFEEI